MRFGAKILFEEVSTAFLSGRRYGLTGPNGSGKSTFMKMLTGELDAQKGTVVRPKRIGVLSQDQFAFDAFRVIDTVIMGNRPLWDALEERDRLSTKTDLDRRGRHAPRRARRHRRGERTATPPRATPRFCWTAWIFPNRCTSAR